jgi:glycosyltransferase involved in cell wall biosynthesis
VSIKALLIGPVGQGGEDVYMGSLRAHPPPGVSYQWAGAFHQGAPGAPCHIVREIALNRIVHRMAIPDMGFRALGLRARFDLIHVHAHPVHLTNLGGTPLVMSEGSSSAVYLGEYLGWDDTRLRKGYRRARRLYRTLGIHDRLLTLGRVTRAYVFSEWARRVNLRWGADPEKLDVIPPGFATPPAANRSERDTFTFLFVGGDFERKGGFEIVEAFDAVVREHPYARLTLRADPERLNPDRLVHSWIGPARRRRILSRLAELERRGVARRLVDNDRAQLMTNVFPKADAFVMPTHAEGFGFTNVEAMSFALPVITSSVGPVPEIVSAERTGLIVEPGDTHGLIEAMMRLVKDPDTARRMGAAGRGDFLARFTLERFQVALGDLYRRALEA